MGGKTLAVTERDRRICDLALRFGAVTREQLQRLGLFTSATRAKARLKALTDQGLLAAHPLAVHQRGVRFVYMPGRLLQPGRRRSEGLSPFFVSHQVGLVDIRIAFELRTTVRQWMSDKDLAALSLGFIPDGYVEYAKGGASFAAFIEYDRSTESLVRLERKVRDYTTFAFSGRFEQQFHRKYFRLLLVAETTGRVDSLSKTAARVTDRMVRLTTLSALNTYGPLAAIWRRPGGRQLESLTA